jgi:hypothetical protein
MTNVSYARANRVVRKLTTDGIVSFAEATHDLFPFVLTTTICWDAIETAVALSREKDSGEEKTQDHSIHLTS